MSDNEKAKNEQPARNDQSPAARPVMTIPSETFTDLATDITRPIIVGFVGGWGDWCGNVPQLSETHRRALKWLSSQPEAGVVVLAHTPEDLLGAFYDMKKAENAGADFGDCSVFEAPPYGEEDKFMNDVALQSGFGGGYSQFMTIAVAAIAADEQRAERQAARDAPVTTAENTPKEV